MARHKKSCCHTEETPETPQRSVDWLLWWGTAIIFISIVLALSPTGLGEETWPGIFSQSIWELMRTMWFGLLLAVIFVGVLSHIPRDLVIGMLGEGGSFSGLLRATLAGVFLDLCSHGILMVGAKLYERGASIGQVMAFLIASPWNSLSLTIIMISLIGIGWTLIFILLSVVIALISGLIFDWLCQKKALPTNSYEPRSTLDSATIGTQLREILSQASYSPKAIANLLTIGIKESRMVFRWLFFGVILASAIRTFVPMETYQQLFGPTLAGLGLTLIAATIIEVCSEGSTPIAADLLTRGGAPGNSFTFLMAGVSTDYTEVMVLKDTTRSWKIALFLPLITLPQVLVLGWLLNQL